jgi:hypothetical protein
MSIDRMNALYASLVDIPKRLSSTASFGDRCRWRGDMSNDSGDATITRIEGGWMDVAFDDGRVFKSIPLALLDGPRWRLTAAYSRERHAAHTSTTPPTGWDLERWDVTSPTLPTSPVAGAEYHCGYVDRDGVQHWIFTRRAPLSDGTCVWCAVEQTQAAAPQFTTPALIKLAAEKAPLAEMRSSAESCINDALACIAKGDDECARQWAERSLGYSVGVFKARELTQAKVSA